AQYWFDNSSNLTDSIEDGRYDALGGAVPRPQETRHLLTAFERFAYGVNRTDFVRLSVGLQVPLKARRVGLHPMLEWQWDIPVNRQGFQCVETTNPNINGCLANEGLKAFPMALTLGLRLLTPPKGLAFTVAADIGLTGTRDFVQELAPTVPYNVILGIAYAFDARPSTPVSSSIPDAPVAIVATDGEVHGQVVEQGNGNPIADAVVAVLGQEVSPQVTDSDGRFVTYGLPKGEVLLEVSHPEYETTQCRAPVPSDVQCTLVPSSLDGALRILVIDRDGEPIPELEITVRGPTEHRLISNAVGIALVQAIEPGAYTAHVDDPAYLIAVAELVVLARQETSVQLRVLLKPSRSGVVVKKNEIALRRQISFATGSDEILPNSEPILLEVADALLRNPDIELVEIEGHTDNRGDFAVNMQLSQQRAEAVQRWLVQHGVGPARLMAKGYGPTHPVVPNITQQNRARNRRVQFTIVRRVELSAAAAP
ncbi:MAG: OmpA family protein, partial [Polyangiales bacterium]